MTDTTIRDLADLIRRVQRLERLESPTTAGLISPLTTRGDLLTQNPSGTHTRLAIGTSGFYLRSNGTDPIWAALLASDITFSGLTTGAVWRATGATSAAFGQVDLANGSAVTGLLGLARGGVNADLSGTGGTGRVLKQTSAGAAVTVAALVAGDLPVATTSTVGGIIVGNGLQIASNTLATKALAAIYSTNAGQSISNNTLTIVDYEDSTVDTDSRVTTGVSWHFTVSIAGQHDVIAAVLLNGSAGWAATETAQLDVYKNGSFAYNLSYYVSLGSASSIATPLHGSACVDCAVNDTLDIRVTQVSGGTITLNTTSGTNFVAIRRR